MRQELFVRDKTDYYLARLALEVRRLFAKNPEALKVEDFLLDFDPPEPEPDPATIEEAMSKMQKLKTAVFGWLHIKPPPSTK